ncbi:RRN3-domain-containing protein [Delitschia confertaspora ATCC 74209]|uniref:RRN3-domain-containing protein n=1 Tax=Delitschia confertaspora ATCC 74209 TaxID=1513339 RepID=A0A9P4JEV0_9PLEO|nr:RRN3-domain-containing protein [Delitschia confertaspora ATCC 74209]
MNLNIKTAWVRAGLAQIVFGASAKPPTQIPHLIVNSDATFHYLRPHFFHSNDTKHSTFSSLLPIHNLLAPIQKATDVNCPVMVSLASLNRATDVLAPSVGSSLKRKQQDRDVDSDDLSSPPTERQIKRLKVKFDPEVDVHILPDWNEKSEELVGEEVRRALERHATGDNTGYDQILHLLTVKPTSNEAPLTGLLRKYIVALTNNIAALNPKCSTLVHAVIDCAWLARKEPFVQSYGKLLQSLLAVQPGYTASVLQMLVNFFVELSPPGLRQQDDPFVQRPRMQARVHDILKALLRQDPMLSSHLSPVLPASFPFPTDDVRTHIRYIKNILRVTAYCPELKGEITALIMERLVKIDVQIQVDMDEIEDDIEEDLVQGKDANEEEDDGADVSDDDSDSSEESINEEERRLKELKESVGKLDAIMDLMFEYYDSIFRKGDLDEIDDTFESLLSQFASIILPTYRSRHVQFLLFRFGQYSPEHVERFAGCCSHLAFDHRRPQVLRVTAAAYLASFIARGAKVDTSVVRQVFDLLCHHMEQLRVQHEAACKGPDLRRYGTYYAISQALVYTFCFRWRELIVTKNNEPVDDELIYQGHDFVWYHDIQKILHRNIFSKLNPLKICSPAIVNQFARIAHHLHFLYVFPLIETNKRVRLSRALAGNYLDGVVARDTALTMKKGEDSFLLDAYFPFDPYVLPRSRRWVEDKYVEWKPIPGLDSVGTVQEVEDDEDDEEDEDSDEDSDSDPKEHPVVDEEESEETDDSR